MRTSNWRFNLSRASAALALLAGTSAMPSFSLAEMGHRSQVEATEQCTTLPVGLQEIIAAMEKPGERVEALVQRSDMAPLMPAVRRIDVALHPAERVSLAMMAGRNGQGRSGDWAETFAGLLELTVPSDGVYRISASSRTWIDVMESETAVARVRPTHRLHRCGHVHKSVEFALKKGGSYWLEVSGSESPVISLIITPEMD
ncbi:MAG: hypothetical protein NW701_15480 [Nitrospira sp.]